MCWVISVCIGHGGQGGGNTVKSQKVKREASLTQPSIGAEDTEEKLLRRKCQRVSQTARTRWLRGGTSRTTSYYLAPQNKEHKRQKNDESHFGIDGKTLKAAVSRKVRFSEGVGAGDHPKLTSWTEEDGMKKKRGDLPSPHALLQQSIESLWLTQNRVFLHFVLWLRGRGRCRQEWQLRGPCSLYALALWAQGACCCVLSQQSGKGERKEPKAVSSSPFMTSSVSKVPLKTTFFIL